MWREAVAVGYEQEVWTAIRMLGAVVSWGIVLVWLIGGKDLLKRF